MIALKRLKSQKKLKETTSASSMTEECDVFNDGLDNEDCRGILLNCLKNLEKEVKYIRSLVDQNRQTQIKDKKSLTDLSKPVNILIGNIEVNNQKDINNELYVYYKNLFNEGQHLSEHDINNFLNKVSKFPQLSTEQCLNCEECIT